MKIYSRGVNYQKGGVSKRNSKKNELISKKILGFSQSKKPLNLAALKYWAK